jgi:REP element-mobilizing transposase RayT
MPRQPLLINRKNCLSPFSTKPEKGIFSEKMPFSGWSNLMKNRDYKEFAANQFYHIYNRGQGKGDIFLDNADRKFFLLRLKENLWPEQATITPSPGGYIRQLLPSKSFCLHCYCLMPNHFHFLLEQTSNLPISKLLAKVCTSYSKYFNKKYERVGHTFQDAFKAVLVVSDAQLLWLSAYIHQNPNVGGLVTKLSDYPWSSYLDYAGTRNGTLVDKSFILHDVWRKY